MVTVGIEKLSNLREEYRDKIIVFCSGSFDPLHAGHILFFEDCKKQGNILVVSVGSDKTIRIVKGDSHPILNEKIRIKMVDSLKMVDYTILDLGPVEMKDKHASSIIFPILEKLKPDKWVINDDASEISIRKKFAKKLGIELIILKRTCPEEFENISSTNIIRKIKLLDAGTVKK